MSESPRIDKPFEVGKSTTSPSTSVSTLPSESSPSKSFSESVNSPATIGALPIIPEICLLVPGVCPLVHDRTQLLHRYLTDVQDSLGPVTAQQQQLLHDQQAMLDHQRLLHGLEPRSYQAKGQIISIYNCGDRLGWKIGAAIEVMHAPLRFPNQEVWLWESRVDFRCSGIREGSVVLFRIDWRAVDNHWAVVDLRG